MLLAALLIAACGEPAASTTDTRATASPTARATPEPTPTLRPVDAILAECDDAPAAEGEPVTLRLRANSSGFDTDRLEGPRACEPFVIELRNADQSEQHNTAIEPLDLIGAPLFAGELANRGQSARYEVPGLPAGEYRFLCQPHRGYMNGTLVVTES